MTPSGFSRPLVVGLVLLMACNGPQKQEAARNAQIIATAAAHARATQPDYCPSPQAMLAAHELSAAVPATDPWGLPFGVACGGDVVSVTSSGPDKAAGTEDDIRASAAVPERALPLAAKATPVAVSPAPAAESLSTYEIATDTVAAIRGFYPLGCRAGKASADWGACHDEMKGFANVLQCAQGARTLARSALAALPKTKPQSTCGSIVATAHREVVAASATLYGDLVAWLEKNRSKLTPALVNQPLTDACLEVGCDDAPSEFDETHKRASYAGIMAVECTKTLFQCGVHADNVCFINKVADRLGVACDLTENKVGDPLFVRSTSTRVR